MKEEALHFSGQRTEANEQGVSDFNTNVDFNKECQVWKSKTKQK